MQKYAVSAQNAELFKALSVPVRGAIMVVLTERVASTRELADMFGETLENIAGHLRKLVKVNLIEQVDESSRRGRFYKAMARPILHLESWEKLPRLYRELNSVWVAQLIIGDLVESIHGGVFDARAGRTMLRSQVVVDEQGFDELEAVGVRYIEEIMDVQARSAERIVSSDDEGFRVSTCALAFELPS